MRLVVEEGCLTLLEPWLGILREDLSSAAPWVGWSWSWWLWLYFSGVVQSKSKPSPWFLSPIHSQDPSPSPCSSLGGELRGGKDAAELHFAPVLGTSLAAAAVRRAGRLPAPREGSWNPNPERQRLMRLPHGE